MCVLFVYVPLSCLLSGGFSVFTFMFDGVYLFNLWYCFRAVLCGVFVFVLVSLVLISYSSSVAVGSEWAQCQRGRNVSRGS